MIRCNLSDEELRLGDHGVLELSASDMAEELLAYRTARAASAERVREVVQREICAELVPGLREAIAVEIRRAAHRAAEQLAGVGVGLSDGDKLALCYLSGWCNANISEVIVDRDRFAGGVVALDRLLASPPAVDACNVMPFSSRACERGTKSCTTEHGPAVDYLAGIRTILASDMPGEAIRKALQELVGLR